MAAQILFDKKIAGETHDAGIRLSDLDLGKADQWCGRGGGHSEDGSFISFPYAFPAPGKYRLWVQVKTDGQVRTAIFDTIVQQEAEAL